MKAKLLISFVVIVLMILTVSLFPTNKGAPASSSSTIVTEYIKALQTNDKKTIIRLTHDVERETTEIKAKNPQALWRNLIAERYAAVAREIAGRFDNEIVGLFTPGASWKITESRKEANATAVYVSITYPKIDDSPRIGGHFLEAAVLRFAIAPSNLVREVTHVSMGDTFRSTVPLMVFTAGWDSGSWTFRLSASAIGGKQPYSWTAECGGITFDTQDRQTWGMGTVGPDEALFQMQTMPDFKAEPVPCVMTVSDAAGNVDHGYFTVPKIKTPLMHGYCFYRSPWLNRGVKAGQVCIGGELLPITQTANN